MIVDLQNIEFAYSESDKLPSLVVPHWSVYAKEKVFVHGPSGGGKSTLLNLISGMLKPSKGEITVLGERLDKLSAHKRDRFRAMHIGYVFQQFNLIPYLNAIENVQLAHQFGKHRKTDALSQIQESLENLSLPANSWQKPCSTLSIGQQQRVAIARAVVNNPEILIADEPTSSLDEKNRDNFMSLLMNLVEQNGTTLIVVSHDLSLEKYFSRSQQLSDINTVAGKYAP